MHDFVPNRPAWHPETCETIISPNASIIYDPLWGLVDILPADVSIDVPRQPQISLGTFSVTHITGRLRIMWLDVAFL